MALNDFQYLGVLALDHNKGKTISDMADALSILLANVPVEMADAFSNMVERTDRTYPNDYFKDYNG